MFEDLLIPVDNFSFHKCLSEEQWINQDNNICITKKINPTNETWHYRITLQNLTHFIISPSAGYTSKHQCVKQAEKEYAIQYSTKKHSYSRQSSNCFIITSDYYPLQMLKNLEIVGSSEQWYLNIYHDKEVIVNFLQMGANAIVTKKFKTRNQVIVQIQELIASYLGVLYNEKDYILTKGILQKPVEELKEEDIMQLRKTWWLAFVKPEIDLTEIFKLQ